MKRLDVLHEKVRRAEEGGGAERRQRQHADVRLVVKISRCLVDAQDAPVILEGVLEYRPGNTVLLHETVPDQRLLHDRDAAGRPRRLGPQEGQEPGPLVGRERREEVRVEREPITDANRDAALDGPELSEEEHEVTLYSEEPVVEKRVVPKERVRLDKDRVTDERDVSADVRKEQIDTEGHR